MKSTVLAIQAFALGALAAPAQPNGDRSNQLKEALKGSKSDNGVKLAEIFGSDSKLRKRQDNGDDAEADGDAETTDAGAEEIYGYPYYYDGGRYSQLYAYLDETRTGSTTEETNEDWCCSGQQSTGTKDTTKTGDYTDTFSGDIYFNEENTCPCPTYDGTCPCLIDDEQAELDEEQAQEDLEQAQEDEEQAQEDEEQAQLDEEIAESIASSIAAAATATPTDTVAATETEVVVVPTEATETQVVVVPTEATETEVVVVPTEATETEVVVVPTEAAETEVVVVPTEAAETTDVVVAPLPTETVEAENTAAINL